MREKYKRFIYWLVLQERWHRPVIWSAETVSFACAGVASFLLRFEFQIPEFYLPRLFSGLAIWLLVKSLIFRLRRLDRGWWRFASVYDVLRIASGNFLGSIVSCLLLIAFWGASFPRSVYLLDLILSLLLTIGVRMSLRVAADLADNAVEDLSRKRLLIYGAGSAGVMLVRECRTNASLGYSVVGFVDDNGAKSGVQIHGVSVLGSGRQLAAVVREHTIQEVVVAVPSASGSAMTRIVRLCQDAGVRYRTLPGLSEIIESRGLSSQLRDVNVEDLLGRAPVQLDQARISARLHDRVVLVTGAAGSIGSEICRQIARFGPRAIVGFEISENGIFNLEREMRVKFPDVPFHPAIGSIQNECRLNAVFGKWTPSVVYHAAAFKHVPLMEAHIEEAIENNVFGTRNVALAAARHGVSDFVMISSDKAVRPASVMGATKRVAELVINSLPADSGKYVSVRFGNVLGSSGSVIPVFKEQIAAGGPVTVTHPGMERYFMTIPEAVQLVLQASVMANGGEIFVLDMGEPVKIVDLATNLILLSGLRPGQDIQIEFTGIRAGEKLFEELHTGDEFIKPTYHPKIRVFMGRGPARQFVDEWLATSLALCEKRDPKQLIAQLKKIVPDYTPDAQGAPLEANHVAQEILDLAPLRSGAAAGGS